MTQLTLRSSLTSSLARGLAAGAALLWLSAAQAAPTSQYVPLVNQEFGNFKTAYGPAVLPAYGGNVLLRTKHDGLALERFKIFLPPGTRSLGMTYTSYRSEQPGQMSMRFKAAPQIEALQVVSSSMNDTREALAELNKGRELTFYSPGNSGVISGPTAPNVPVRVDSGGFVYVNVSHPGGSAISVGFHVEVDQSCYSNWFANARWDSNGNPLEGVSHTCSGSGAGGGGTVPTDPPAPIPPITPPTPQPARFTLETSTPNVLRGQQLKFTALPLTTLLTSCSGASNGQPSEPVPVVVTQSGLGMKMASATVPANLNGNRLSVTCTSAAGATATRVVELIDNPPTTEQQASAKAQTTVNFSSASMHAAVSLSATVTPPASLVGKRLSVWLAAEVLPAGAAQPLYFLVSGAGTLEAFNGNTTLTQANAAVTQLTAPAAGVTARVFDNAFLQASEAQLVALRVRVYGAYSFEGGTPVVVERTLLDCSSGRCQ